MRRAYVAQRRRRDYNGHMTKTLREAKAKLSELVDAASRGDETVITVRGKAKAMLVPAPEGQPEVSRAQRTAWLKKLRRLREKAATPKAGRTKSDDLWEELREERL